MYFIFNVHFFYQLNHFVWALTYCFRLTRDLAGILLSSNFSRSFSTSRPLTRRLQHRRSASFSGDRKSSDSLFSVKKKFHFNSLVVRPKMYMCTYRSILQSDVCNYCKELICKNDNASQHEK